MQKVWVQLGGASAIAALTLLGTASLVTAQETGVKTAAEELDKRSKPAEGAGGQQGKLSDRSVNVMSSLAFSIMPQEYPGPDGKPIKVNKANPNKFLIPIDDARRIIRVATRSAYAEACELPELERANFEALMKNEEARKTWTREQLLFIRALHIFSVSYFTGNMKITTTEEDNDVQGASTAADLAESKGKEAPAKKEQSAARALCAQSVGAEEVGMLARTEGKGDEVDHRLCAIGECGGPASGQAGCSGGPSWLGRAEIGPCGAPSGPSALRSTQLTLSAIRV